MATQNFNIEPYFDDFDESKNFQQILFRPGYAVQARELTQIQSILQRQIANFGSHIFRDGVIINGGDFTYDNSDAKYIRLAGNETANAQSFTGKFITDTTDRGVRAYVIEGFNATDTEPKTLVVRYLTGEKFTTTEAITDEDAVLSATTANSSLTGASSTFSINEGIFFIDGYFVKFDSQTIVLDRYSDAPTLRVGFEIDNSIVDENQDTSLLDPALFASNYQAPGATRFKKALKLSTRNLESTDDTAFVEVVRLQNGLVTRVMKNYVYNELEKTLARRTFDESGNYTVRPFLIELKENTANVNTFNVVVSSGKAYVKGFEFEQTYPTILVDDKAKDNASVTSYDLTINYQNYVDVTKVRGPIALETLTDLTVHCVNTASINTTSTTALSATEIGKLRVRAVDYQSGLSSLDAANNAANGVYKFHVFDVRMGNRTANATGGTANTITLDTNASSVNDAYKGVIIRIVKNNGANVGELRQIESYNGATKVATVSREFDFGTPTINTVFSLDYQFGDAESFVTNTSTTLGATMDVSPTSKFTTLQDPYTGAFISDTNLNTLVFPLPYNYVVGGSVANVTVTGRATQTVTFNSNTVAFDTPDGMTTTPGNSSPLPGSDAVENFLIQIITPGSGSIYTAGQLVNLANVTNQVSVSSLTGTKTTVTITLPNIGTGTVAKVYYKYDLELGYDLRRTKSLGTANSSFVETSSGDAINANVTVFAGATVAQPGLQVNFVRGVATETLKTPNSPQSLYCADIVQLKKVYDLGTNAITTANLASATDITARYTLDNGQRDDSYEHGTISLKPGNAGPTGNVVVFADIFTHSFSGISPGSYFDVNSYPSYDSIPKFTSPSTGLVYELRDSFDFRPIRKAGTSGVNGEYKEITTPVAGTDLQADFKYYLGRIDKVIVTADRDIKLVKGVPSLKPKEPAEEENGMTIYKLVVPPYTANVTDVQLQYIDNRRFTMRDIGNIEKRVQKIEYYTALNFLEKQANDVQIIDSETGLVRFKNGIIADPFTGHSVGDVLNPDYRCSIDSRNREMRPAFYKRNLKLEHESDTGAARKGPLYVLPYSEEAFVTQNVASKSENVNPYNSALFLGQMDLTPASDVWFDTEQKPDTITYDIDRAAFMAAEQQAGIVWNDWQTVWTGEPVDTVLGTTLTSSTQITGPNRGQVITTETVETTISRSVDSIEQRTGILTTVGSAEIRTVTGNRLIDSSLIPFIRKSKIRFVGKGFLPQTRLYTFFDKVEGSNYVSRLNIINLAHTGTNKLFSDEAGNNEDVEVFEPSTNRVLGYAKVARAFPAKIVLSDIRGANGNSAFITANNTFLRSANAAKALAGANSRILSFEHFSGNTNAVTTNTITLSTNILGPAANSISSNSSYLIGKTITLAATEGAGAGQVRTISNYNVQTRVATVSAAFDSVPTGNVVYSIGELVTDTRGEVYGEFHIPDPSTGTKFRVGDKVLRLVDSPTGELADSVTNGDAHYFAQGTLNSFSREVTATRTPVLVRSDITDERAFTTTVVRTETQTTQTTDWVDPLAQTILVDQSIYPRGLFITSLRLMVETKDPTIPLQVQIRPVVNGFPHASQILPFATAFVDPEDIIEVDSSTLGARYANTSSTQPLDDAALYTEVKFPAPVYLNPGQEYAIVLLANSFKYRVYLSRFGDKIYGTNRLISSQPYLGSLFKSQNSTTWTPIQEEDLMFKLMKAKFTSGSEEVVFNLAEPPTSNVAMDLFQVTQQNLVLPGTSIEGRFSSTVESTGEKEPYRLFEVGENYEFNDSAGRRSLNASNTSFQLKLTMRSNNGDVSPVIDTERLSVIAVENYVNNLGLSNTDIVITNGGAAYSNASNVTVTISGGNGSGATGRAIITSNVVTGVEILTSGSGYTGTPTVTISGDTTSTSNAVAVCIGEDSPAGGPGFATYITRKVTLADGLDAGDLRVYLDAYKPVEGEILVYYKVLSADDGDTFDSRPYQLMTKIGGVNENSLNPSDYRQYIFAPGANNVASNSVAYDTYTDFKYFALKIVLITSNSTKVPRVRNLRGLAMPSLL